MEPFRFQQFTLGGRFHVPLPKMTPLQMELFRRRLESTGFRTGRGRTLRGTKAGVTVLVDPSGLCSSNEDLTDMVAPLVPGIIECQPKRVPAGVLRGLYFMTERRGDELLLRLSPRLEFQSLWDELRTSGSCALTPDERAVYSGLLSLSPSLTPLLTDFPVRGCKVRRIGRRQYYDSRLRPSVASSTLRGMGQLRQRNSYLPRVSLLRLSSARLREATGNLFKGLGEWCYLTSSRTRQKL